MKNTIDEKTAAIPKSSGLYNLVKTGIVRKTIDWEISDPVSSFAVLVQKGLTVMAENHSESYTIHQFHFPYML